MVDRFAGMAATLDSPYVDAVAVVPSDTTVIETTRALYIGVAGDVVAIMAGGETVTFKACPVGLLKVRVTGVKAATAATNILALY